MPKQVYVYPGNINDADTIEGTRQVLEPAVDTVYTYDSASGNYVDVNNTANAIPHDVYLFTNSQQASGQVRENYLHYTADAPTDSSGKSFIPFVSSTGSAAQRFGIIKVDDSQTSGYSTVFASNQTAYNKYYYQPVKTKILWDSTTETIIIALADVMGTDSSSYNRGNMVRRVSVLYKYDKASDSITIIQGLDNSAFLRKVPVSGNYFYYDSSADTYTFYQLLLGPTGTLEMRKTVVNQTSMTESLESVSLANASITPQFPDSLSDPYYFFQKVGMLEKKPWVELSSALDSNTTEFTIILPTSPNISTESDSSVILKELVLNFERGQYSYDSSTSTWTFTVSSEFSVDSLTKQFYTYTVKFLNDKTGLVPARHPSRPESSSYSYDSVERIRFISFDQATALTDIDFEVAVKIAGFHTYNTEKIQDSVYFGTFDASGFPVISYWLPLGAPNSGNARFYHSFQINHTDTPPVLFFGNGSNVYPLVKASSQSLVDNLAQTTGKYLYDISQASSNSKTYFIINRIANSRQHPYVIEGIKLEGASKEFIVLNESLTNIPGIQGPQTYAVEATPALNYSAGGTITNVYKRDSSGLESLTMWIRSGTTIYTTFSIEFERALDPSSILEYIRTNTNVDNLFVVRNATLNTDSLHVFSKLGQFFHSDTGTDDVRYRQPTVDIGRIKLRLGGTSVTSLAPKGNVVFYNSANGTLLETDVNDASSVVLSSLILYNMTIDYGGSNYYRHYKTNYVSSGAALTTLYNNYYLQIFKNFWTADYEDTIEITIGSNVYKYVVVGKYSLDEEDYIVTVLEDVV